MNINEMTDEEIRKEYLTTPEAAALTKYKARTLYQYRWEGKLSIIRVRQKAYWKRTELLKFMGLTQ